MTKQFQIGKRYSTRSIGDHNAIFSFTIVSRTQKSVSFREDSFSDSSITQRRVKVQDDVEQFKPFGNYSMCPIIKADREYVVQASDDRDIRDFLPPVGKRLTLP